MKSDLFANKKVLVAILAGVAVVIVALALILGGSKGKQEQPSAGGETDPSAREQQTQQTVQSLTQETAEAAVAGVVQEMKATLTSLLQFELEASPELGEGSIGSVTAFMIANNTTAQVMEQKGETALVTVESLDMEQIAKQARQQAQEQYGDDFSELDLSVLINDLASAADAPKRQTAVNVPVVYENGAYKAEKTYEFLDALMGGLLSYYGRLLKEGEAQ